jgi:membrane associated rhomboid family serine protease
MSQDPKDQTNIVDLNEVRTQKNKDEKPPTQSFLTIPPLTKISMAILVGIHGLIFLLPIFGFEDGAAHLYMMFGFIPATWSHLSSVLSQGHWWVLLSPVTYALLHGSWLHIGMNGLMLLAFGSGAEKSWGIKNTLILFWGSSLCAVLSHFLLDPNGIQPVIGASGGLSGLFGAMLVMLQRQGQLNAGNRILPFVVLWIVISIVFGLMGAPDGSSVAWVAHIGGFLAGIGLGFLLLRKQNLGQ